MSDDQAEPVRPLEPTEPADRGGDDGDGWEPVDGLAPIVERRQLDRLELMQEVTHATRGAILGRLVRPRSMAELADELDVPVTRLYHHVHRLEAHGLVRVVATRRVGAALERRYQAVARGFSVAPEVLERADREELATALGGLFDLARLAFEREVRGELVELLHPGGDPDAAPDSVVLTHESLRLTPERRRELVRRLVELLEEYHDEPVDPSAERFLTFVAAFPTSS